MTNIELRKEWETRVAAFKASGQSTIEWCAAHDLKLSQLQYWLRKYKATDKPGVTSSQWMSVKIDDTVPSVQRTGLALRVGHAVIEVQHGFDSALLKEVVQTLTML